MLEGHRVRLRLLGPNDVLQLANLANDHAHFGEHLRYVLNSPGELMAMVSENNMVTDARFTLAVEEKETKSLVGSIHVYPAHSRYTIPEIALNIYPPEQRRLGFGFEAVALIGNLLFYTRPVPKVTVVTNTRNTFLIDTLTRFGFEVEAVMRRACFYAGAHQDHAVISIQRDMWLKIKELPELEGLDLGFRGR